MIGYRRRNQIRIIREARRRRLGHRGAAIGLMTASIESGFRNYANANVPTSLRIPHDAIGYDHASLGVFQQQTGTRWANRGMTTMGSPDGWGRPETLMSVTASAGLFFDALESLGDWRSLPRGVACQKVQGSAFPDRYATREQWAVQRVRGLWVRADPTRYDRWRQRRDRAMQLVRPTTRKAPK